MVIKNWEDVELSKFRRGKWRKQGMVLTEWEEVMAIVVLELASGLLEISPSPPTIQNRSVRHLGLTMDNSERTKKSSQRKKPEEKNGLVDSHKTKWTANRSPSPKGMGSSKNGDRPHLPHDDRSGQPVVADVDLGEIRDDPSNREPIEEVPAPPVGHTSRPQSREQKNTRPPRGPSSPSTSNPIKNIQDYSQDRKKPEAPREHERVHKIAVNVDDTLSDTPNLLKSPQEPTRGSDDEGSPTKRGSNYSETKQRSNSEELMGKNEPANTISMDEKPEDERTGGEMQDPGNSTEDSKSKDESQKTHTITVYTPHSKENRIQETTADKMKDFGIQLKAIVRESDAATGTSSSSGQDPQDGPKSVNILLLGESGVGKTTLINSLVNVLSHKTLGSMLTAEVRILVDTAFILSDENHQIHRVKVRSNFGQNPMNEQLNDKGEGPMIHSFPWDDTEGRTKMLNIIDTPGMGDSRGLEQDQENFEKILRCINQLGELHAICIVMKPNQARFLLSFRYNIERFLTRLHRDAVKNILFCFTNTRSTFYRPGDTLTTLHSYLADLKKDRGVLIEADKHNIFCIDNDCFRYVLVVKQGVYTRTDELDRLFAESWERNAREFQKLLARAERLPIHNGQDTLSINRTRELLIILAKPLAEIARNHLLNMKLTENQIIELQSQKSKLKSRIAKKVVKLEPRRLLKPRTVCRSSKCTRWVKSGHQVISVYKVCHDDCNLERSPQDGYCWAFCISKGYYGDRCKVCGCHRNCHQHEFYEILAVTHEVEDRRTLDDFRDVAQRAADKKKLLEEEKEKLKSLKFEHDSIRDFCAEAAVFLLENAIKSKADPYLLQIQNLIRDEENKMKLGGDMETYYELEALLSQHKIRVKSLQEDIRDNRRTPVTCEQLLQKMENLALQPHCGEQVKQLRALCEENLAELEQKTQEESMTSHV